ncbi:nitrous oxide reductase family maturation protein NosD [Phaeovulum sp.]|uniref:nitrous oxide reductase family maturation protein NosD n=1 Tax=Phaeovulum sp. TaxID=2934796 RepID=UPI0027318DE6|nr:nitrous oxide reductase family maturation protein NosD [Phaeovulum sp.]MDP1668619.1 nitrous oxide reductase family maturation protein NosD [Phaeovulum sp.]MDZ4119892.1 nitrous oxide reductase family maturation protein NosD [Phaeovulum sp.]
MIRLPALVLAALLLAAPAAAVERGVPAEAGALQSAIAGADPGDVLILAPGRHLGPVLLDRPITLDGRGAALVEGNGTGSVITITGSDVTLRGLEIRGSGSSHGTIDAGVQLGGDALRVTVEGNQIIGNLHGVDVHGARDSIVRANTIIGRRDNRMNDRGNGVYVWDAPGTLIEGNSIRYGRDGIFSNVSRDSIYRGNVLRDLRYGVHYMYTNRSEVSGNVSIGNHLGFALMYSNQIIVRNNISINDRDHGLMLNFANSSEITGNLVRGADKCTFIYNAHRNQIIGNRFEDCGIGIHFTAGSERNDIADNAFIGNRTQVKYVGTRDVEWSAGQRGNYWSDHAAFDLDGNGIADTAFRPNDLMDHILWSQPAAALLLGSPAVQLVRWSQSNFPALLPGGVLDSHPLMRPTAPQIPATIAALAAEAVPAWQTERQSDAELDPLSRH